MALLHWPWRFFTVLAKDEVLFRRFQADLDAAAGAVGEPSVALRSDVKVSKENRKRRHSAGDRHEGTGKKFRQDAESSIGHREHGGVSAVEDAQKDHGGSFHEEGAHVSRGHHIFLAAKSRPAPKAMPVASGPASGSRVVGRPALLHQRAAITRGRIPRWFCFRRIGSAPRQSV